MTKTYAQKSSAVRAARKAGLDDGSFEVYLVKGRKTNGNREDRWTYREIDADTPDLEEEAPEQEEVREPEFTEDGKLRASVIENPTKTVWVIADRMKQEDPEARRKDIIQACVDAGIAFYTARTQYQQWFAARKEIEGK